MGIVSHKKLREFYETKGYEDSRVALERWYDIAEKAEWKNSFLWLMTTLRQTTKML